MPVQGKRVIGWDVFEKSEPGTFIFAGQKASDKKGNIGRHVALVCKCPQCGNDLSVAIVPGALPHWQQTGPDRSPTLTPGLSHYCGWAGFLIEGVFRADAEIGITGD